MNKIATKVAVITGAARGIGLAVARRFIAEGYSVGLLDIDGPAQEAAAKGLNRPDQVLALAWRCRYRTTGAGGHRCDRAALRPHRRPRK